MQFNKLSIFAFAFWVILFSLVGFTIAYNSGSAPPSVSHTAYQIEQGTGSLLNAQYVGGLDVNQIIAAVAGSAPGGVVADWNSWIILGSNGASLMTHNLGGSPDNYIVQLRCKSNSIGINDGFYIGSSPQVQLAYRELTSTQIRVYRIAASTACDFSTGPNVFVKIYRMR